MRRTPSKHSDLSGFRVGERSRAIAIWLDHQYEDAVNLLRDPDYVVKNPVDWEEFDKIQSQVSTEMEATTERANEMLVNFVVVGAALLLLAGGVYLAFIK